MSLYLLGHWSTVWSDKADGQKRNKYIKGASEFLKHSERGYLCARRKKEKEWATQSVKTTIAHIGKGHLYLKKKKKKKNRKLNRKIKRKKLMSK